MSATTDPDAVEDPVGYFLQDVTYHGKSERTRRAYERVLRRFDRFLEDGGAGDASVALADATRRDCMAWVHRLRSDLAESTVATYASYLHRFYDYMTQVGAFDENPMALVVEEMDETIDVDPARRDVPLDRMREFVAGVRHPLERAVVVALLKTGVRAGELCNLDLRDLNLDIDLGYDVPVRPQLEGRPDSVFVSPEPSVGAVVNGERRTAANKRRRATVVPVDDELADVLRKWLAVRPDARSSAEPLFVGTRDTWGRRVTPDVVHHLVETRAREVGWYRDGGGAAENVTPHYFRHFFTTHLRDRTGDRGVVKYLRGDVASDVIDTYTHNWGDRVHDTYRESIYRLL